MQAAAAEIGRGKIRCIDGDGGKIGENEETTNRAGLAGRG